MQNHFISKSELAQSYFPHISSHSALNKLMALITTDDRLLALLTEKGYRKEQRHFTPLQLEAIYSTFGRP